MLNVTGGQLGTLAPLDLQCNLITVCEYAELDLINDTVGVLKINKYI